MTATAAWSTSSGVAVAESLPGFSSNRTVQSPCTASKLDDKVVLLEDFLKQHPHTLSVETEGQRPMSLDRPSVRQI